MRKFLVIFIFISGYMQLAGMEELEHAHYQELELEKFEPAEAEADEGDSSCDDDDNLGAIPVKCIRDCCFRVSVCIFNCLTLIGDQA